MRTRYAAGVAASGKRYLHVLKVGLENPHLPDDIELYGRGAVSNGLVDLLKVLPRQPSRRPNSG